MWQMNSEEKTEVRLNDVYCLLGIVFPILKKKTTLTNVDLCKAHKCLENRGIQRHSEVAAPC